MNTFSIEVKISAEDKCSWPLLLASRKILRLILRSKGFINEHTNQAD